MAGIFSNWETVRRTYPWLEVVHILGFSVLFGCVTVFDLRLLGYYRRLSIADAVQYFLRLTHISFLAVAVSGFFLFAAQPTVLVNNIAFRFKLLLLAIAFVNAAVFHYKYSHKTQRLFPLQAIALLSLLTWIGIIVCGRLIAYV